MKRLIKRTLRALYRRTAPLRRPFRDRFATFFRSCVSSSFDEVRLLLEDHVNEVYRLRHEVAILKDEVSRLRAGDREDARSAA